MIGTYILQLGGLGSPPNRRFVMNRSKKQILPEFPKIPHVPFKPNLQEGDVVSPDEDSKIILESEVYIEEKLDGANCAMILYDDHPIIRNRSNILNKGYVKNTPAKVQFKSVWNWFYENKTKFEKLNELFGGPIAVYGEWLYALHGIKYDLLPDVFIAYEIYNYEKYSFLDPVLSRELLEKAGFFVTPLLYKGLLDSFTLLEDMCSDNSYFSSTDQIEGVCIKIAKNGYIERRYKFIRPNYVQGYRWSFDRVQKQMLK